MHCSGTCEAIPTVPSPRLSASLGQHRGGFCVYHTVYLAMVASNSGPVLGRVSSTQCQSYLVYKIHGGSLSHGITSARQCFPEAGPSGVRWPRDNPCFALPRQMPILGFWVPASWPPPVISLCQCQGRKAENLAMGFSWDSRVCDVVGSQATLKRKKSLPCSLKAWSFCFFPLPFLHPAACPSVLEADEGEKGRRGAA